MNITDLIIYGVTQYVFKVHLILLCLFILSSIFSHRKKSVNFPLLRLDNVFIRLTKHLYKYVFNLYKLLVVVILTTHLPLVIPLLINYIFNLLALSNLSNGQTNEKYLKRLAKNPFRQYEAMYYLIEEDSDKVQKQYNNFSMGFWLLLPFFLTGATIIGYLFSVLMVLLWPTLTILQLLYIEKTISTSNKLKHYAPFLLQLISINLLGSFLLYIKTNK